MQTPSADLTPQQHADLFLAQTPTIEAAKAAVQANIDRAIRKDQLLTAGHLQAVRAILNQQ